jgi:hypothetical protein
MSTPDTISHAFRPGAALQVASGASSAQSSALSAGCRLIRVSCTAAARIAIGANPTATSTSALVTPYFVEYFSVNGGDKVAAIQEAVAGKVSITEVES